MTSLRYDDCSGVGHAGNAPAPFVIFLNAKRHEAGQLVAIGLRAFSA